MANDWAATLTSRRTLIDGRWVGATGGAEREVVDPASGRVVGAVPDMGAEDVEEAVTAAHRAFHGWRRRSARQRTQVLRRWSELVMGEVEPLARLLTREQGKPLREARAEILQAAAYLEWFAEEGRRAYGETIPANTTDRRLIVQREPVGVVGVITPWNFPASMIARKLAPALAAGCTVVVKPAEETPLSALALAALSEEAGVPAGVVNVVTGLGPVLGPALTSNPLVRKISFTGSTEIGKVLARDSAATLKRLSLELGGNAPFIVFGDADVGLAVQASVTSKFRNCGQTCVAANRIFVHRSVAEQYLESLKSAVEKLVCGPGERATVDCGPLINVDALNNVKTMVASALDQGARLVTGGVHLGGLFYAPTVLGDVRDDMLVMQDEIFGPVAPVTVFDETDEVVERANGTPYGLAAYVYTRDYQRIVQVTEELEFGMVGVNEAQVTTEVAPFGGIKYSGYGREGSRLGLDDYLNVKYVCVGGLH